MKPVYNYSYLFQRWLSRAKPGDQYVYHTGSLMVDRVRFLSLLGRAATLPNEPTHSMARAAWNAYNAGYVRLVQRKRGPNHYEYIAVRRK